MPPISTLTDIDICARALMRIGANPISSFDDDTAEADVAGLLYGQIRDTLLSAYPWSFAKAQSVLAASATKPVADFTHSFDLPADALRVLSAGTPHKGRGLHYRLQGRKLHCNAEQVILSYLFHPLEEDTPAYFNTALIARLAAEFCIPLTESTSRAETLMRLAETELAKARSIDAQQDSPQRLEDFSLIKVR